MPPILLPSNPQLDPRGSRALPGRSAAHYLKSGPDLLPIRIIIALLHLAGAAVIILNALAGGYLAAGYDYILRLLVALRVLAHSAASNPPPGVTLSIFIRQCTTCIQQHRARDIRQRCTTLATAVR